MQLQGNNSLMFVSAMLHQDEDSMKLRTKEKIATGSGFAANFRWGLWI
jgi:hypothetical protein